MDLTLPVKLKNIPTDFHNYCNNVRKEQEDSLAYTNSKDCSWKVPQSLIKKVNNNGTFKPYFGDTIVINSGENEIYRLEKYQDYLYSAIPALLSEPLNPSEFHITIHDLTSSPEKNSIEKNMEENRQKCKERFRKLSDYFKTHPEERTVDIKSTYIYPCCNISIVMGFVPATEKDFRIIMNLYNLFDEVVYLDYWLRMHITLSYFKPFEFRGEQIQRLYKSLTSLNPNLSVSMDLMDIVYERFDDMNKYYRIDSI